MEMQDNYDVIVLGGGLAGLTFARHLGMARPGTRIVVLEGAVHPPPESAFKVGESSVELAGRYFRDTLKLKEHLDAEQLPKLGLRYFLPTGDKTDIRDRLEYGPQLNKVPVPFRGLLVPSYQLDRGRLEGFLASDFPETTSFCDQTRIVKVELDREAGHRVTVERDGATRTITAPWVLDASGRKAILKRQLGLEEPTEHHCNSVWFRVDGRIKVDDWTDDPTWLDRIRAPVRWQSTCQLIDTGYWVWIIPLAPDRTSVGIVADPRIHPYNTMNKPSRALQWLADHEPQLATGVQGKPFLDFLALVDYCENTKVEFSRDRWGLSGDAGYFTDPFYSPGSDFIAVANTYNIDLITRDLAGEDITHRVERANYYFKLLYTQFVRVYRDHYPTMGNAQVMAAKIAFDNGFYWGWVVLLFQNGRMCDTDFLDSFHDEVLRSVSLQGQVEQFLREWAAVENPPVATRQHIDQFDMKMLWSIYTTLIKPVDGDALKRRLRENLDRLEAFAEVLFRRATRGDARVAAAPRIDVHKLTMDRDRWDEVGLFGGPDRAAMVERIRQDMVALFVDGSVDPAERAAAVTTLQSGEPMLVPYAAPAAMEDGGAFDGMV